MTPEEFEIQMQDVQEALLQTDLVRIVIGRAMTWDRDTNRLATVQSATVYVDRPYASGRANWTKVGLPITVAPGKSRADLLDALSGLVRQASEDPDVD